MSKVRFITLEGGEAAGKTTQLELLRQRLAARTDQVILTREPGGTPLGEAIRHLVKHAPEGQGMSAEAEILLFLASRAQLVREVIAPALERGDWVLCDRFLDSTTVYQGAGRNLPGESVERLNAFAVGNYRPQLTLVLDLPREVAEQRRQSRTRPGDLPDRMEGLPADFYDRVRAGYHALAQAEPNRVKLVSAQGTVEETAQTIWKEVAHAFSF